MGYLFARDKAQITVQIPKFYYLPGETVTGTLQLEVLAKLEITAVRISLEGKESSSVKVGNSRYKGEFVHFSKLVTCFGHSKQSGRKSGAELDVGTYVYPFRFQLPRGAPPSYNCKVEKSTAKLTYVLKASVVIPNSLDAERKWVIIVRATAPMQQVLDRVSVAKKMETRRLILSKINDGGSCCGAKKCPVLIVDAVVQPNIVVIGSTNPPTAKDAPPQQNLNLTETLDQDVNVDARDNEDDAPGFFGYTNDTTLPILPPQIVPNVVNVDLRLQLHSNKFNVQKIQVLLLEVRTVRAETHTATATTIVSEQTLSFAKDTCLHGSMEKRLAVTMNLREQLSYFKDAEAIITQNNANRANEDNKRVALPLPTMATKLLEVTVMLQIRFPGIDAQVCNLNDITYFVGAVDPLNQLPPVPVRYTQAVLLPEDEFLSV